MRKYGRVDDEGKLRVLCGSNCGDNELRATLPQSPGRVSPMIVMEGLAQQGHWCLPPGASIGAKRMETMPNLTGGLLSSYLIILPSSLLIGYNGAAIIASCVNSPILQSILVLSHTYTLTPHVSDSAV